MAEVLDVVDSKNRLTGVRRPRETVHRDGDWHRASHVWILNKEREVLCQKRSSKKEWFPNRWDMTFGGHVKAGDSYKSTAIEELAEELGIRAKPSELKFLTSFKVDRKDNKMQTFNREFLKVYILRTKKTVADFRIQKEEISKIKFVPVSQLKKLLGLKSKIKFIPENTYYMSILRKIANI